MTKKHDDTEINIEERMNDLEEKCNEFENKYKRALADYENLRKRTEEDKEKIIKFANEILIVRLLEILDDLEEAQKHINDSGIDKVVDKFRKTLESQGLGEIETEGADFDPEVHEAIETVNGKKNKVIKVHRKGYKFLNKPLRAALVAVGSGEKE